MSLKINNSIVTNITLPPEGSPEIVLENCTISTKVLLSVEGVRSITLTNCIIGESAFEDLPDLTDVTIANCIVGRNNFTRTNPDNITIANSVIGENIFGWGGPLITHHYPSRMLLTDSTFSDNVNFTGDKFVTLKVSGCAGISLG